MANGVEVYSAASEVRLSISDKLTRIMHSQTIAADTSGSVVVPGFDSSRGAAFAVLSSSDFRSYEPHIITSTGETVYWDPSPRSGYGASSKLFVVMYE